ncbi:MAG TPA: PPOX class F420-dependent oxidoreductase [Ktedonobacterales bacterium]|nr:PPOX class F420-dependent oxidoreductase [Ktedonobacterales bacterium]
MALSEAARQFLMEKRFAVLATIGADGLPHQTVMWYELRGDTIMMNTAVGRVKDRHLRRDSRASVCVADGYTYVTITGVIQMDENPAVAQEDIKQLAIRYEGQEEGERQSRDQFAKQRRVTLNLPITKVIVDGLDGE